MATLAELVLRRKLKYTENDLTGIVYEPGQYAAQLVGDEAIVSFVDTGGWGIQAFLVRDGDSWGLKADIIIAVNPYGIECRRVGRAFPESPSIQTALKNAKKGGRQPKPTTPDPPAE